MKSAEQVLKSAHRPLTSEEIISRAKGKQRRSVFSELKNLRKHKLIVRMEVRLTMHDFELGQPIVLYKWIG